MPIKGQNTQLNPLMTQALIMLLLLLPACTTASPTAQITSVQFASPSPNEPLLATGGEFLHQTGQGAEVLGPFELENARSLQIGWRYSGEGAFRLSIRNEDTNMLETRFGLVTFAYSAGPGMGITAYFFVPGTYHVEIESQEDAGESWEVWLASSANTFSDQDESDQVVRLQGSTPGTSEPFAITGDTPISFLWEYSGDTDFQFALIRLEPENPHGVVAPILLESAPGSVQGDAKLDLPAGRYSLDIQLGAGPWEIEVEMDKEQ